MSPAGKAPPLAVSAATLREGKRLVDVVWLTTFVVSLVAAGIPWYLGAVDLRLDRLAWTMFVAALLYWAGSSVVVRWHRRSRLIAGSVALNVAGVFSLVAIWHLAGGLENPALLLAFVPPVVASGAMLLGWQPYLLALSSIVGVGALGLLTSTGLRWWSVQGGGVLGWLASHVPQLGEGSTLAITDAGGSPGYAVLLLSGFSVLLASVALTSESLASLLLRTYRRLLITEGATETAESLARDLLDRSPVAVAMVRRETGEIVMASDTFLHQFFRRREEVLGRRLVDIADFAYQDIVEDLVERLEGQLASTICSIDGEVRALQLRASRVEHGGETYSLVAVVDVTRSVLLGEAFDTSEDAWVVIGPNDRVALCNEAMAGRFETMEEGREAAAALETDGLQPGWWRPGRRQRRQRHVELGGESYAATIWVRALAGERRPLTVVRLRREETGG